MCSSSIDPASMTAVGFDTPLPAMAGAHVVEGVLDDPLAPLAGDDGDALGGVVVVVDVMLDAGIQALGVLADDDEVDSAVARLDAGEAAGGANVGVEVELLAEGHVGAAVAFAHRRRQGSLVSA